MIKRVILPACGTEEMHDATNTAMATCLQDGHAPAFSCGYLEAIAASPNAGKVSEEEVKEADRAYAIAFNEQMNHLTGTMSPADAIASASIEGLRAALASLGLEVGE